MESSNFENLPENFGKLNINLLLFIIKFPGSEGVVHDEGVRAFRMSQHLIGACDSRWKNGRKTKASNFPPKETTETFRSICSNTCKLSPYSLFICENAIPALSSHVFVHHNHNNNLCLCSSLTRHCL
ncbi:hypothetical protein POTOM_055279 [Populus tomentosa]|uniref:Uncharacterized protein n=1 Tax=Populus tomentosa TaxID=118781 RepID=A0A8X8C5L6_POPTO|nr:hypothetical protein POTOM_055279 [Populus tomentosa]